MAIERDGLLSEEEITEDRRRDIFGSFDPIEPRTYLKIAGLILASGVIIGCAGKYAADYFVEIVLRNSQ